MIIQSENNSSKFTKAGSKIGAAAGFAYGISKCVRNNTFEIKDGFNILSPSKLKTMSKTQKVHAAMFINLLGIAICAFNGSILGEISCFAVEKLKNLFKKNNYDIFGI